MENEIMNEMARELFVRHFIYFVACTIVMIGVCIWYVRGMSKIYEETINKLNKNREETYEAWGVSIENMSEDSKETLLEMHRKYSESLDRMHAVYVSNLQKALEELKEISNDSAQK